MKIKCPNCKTSYDIKPEVLGPDGRSVKCARCGNRWFVRPASEEASDEGLDPIENTADNDAVDEAEWAADEAEEGRAEEERASEADVDDAGDEPAQEAPVPPEPARKATAFENEADNDDELEGEDSDPAKRPTDIETLAKRPKINVNPNKFKRNKIGAILRWLSRRNYRRIAGMALFGASITICAVLVLFRDQIVKEAPDLASLFGSIGLNVNLRGLEFRDLRTFSEVEDGKQVLVVEGSIRNIGEEAVPVPAVRLSIRGTDLQEIYAWTVEPRTTILKGLDETRFRTILTEPPEGASDIHVRFIDRGQRQVILE